jgi:hypothetical protein
VQEKRKGNDQTPKITNHVDLNAVEDDSESVGNDDKTNVSELTEDRTERHMDASLDQNPIHYTLSDATGENIISDGKGLGFGKKIDGKPVSIKYEKLPPSQREDFPPRYIIGAPDESKVHAEAGHSSKQDHLSSTEKSVFTIASNERKGIKLSVAQRARIAAEEDHAASVPSVPNPSIVPNPSKFSETSNSTSAQPIKTDSVLRGTRSQSPGARVLSKLSEKFVNAVDNSFIGIKAIDNTRSKVVETSTINASETKLTLAQRQKMQRERQLRVLREQGLIKDEGEDSTRGTVDSATAGRSL